jgi:putative DNA-invertase from lambdoid prophage Rac
MKKIAIYCRVSTERQHNVNQLAVLKQFADDRNLEYDVFEDIGSSQEIRPTKQKLLNMIRSGIEYDSIIVYSFDRWARNHIELLQDMNELMLKGVNFISYSEGIDLKTSGPEVLKLLGALYGFELKKISERTKIGLMRAKAAGKKLGRPHGSKDIKKRKTSGYLLKEALKRRDADEKLGRHKGLAYYIDTNKFEDNDELEVILRTDLSKRISNGRRKLSKNDGVK